MPGTWRIIPVSKWLVTPSYEPFRPFERGTTILRGLTNHSYWPLTSVLGWSSSQVAAIQVAVLPPLPSTSSIAVAGAVNPRHRRGRSTARRMAGLLFKMQGHDLTMKKTLKSYPDLPVAKSLQATIMQYLYLLEFVEFMNIYIYYIPVCIYFPSFI